MPPAGRRPSEAFDLAESGYEQARVRADAVREALEVRNRVLDELPDYTRWWARRISVVEEPRRANGPIPGDEEFTGSLESLWEKVHRLAGLLESPSETAEPAPLTKEVHDGFVAVERRFLHDLGDVNRSQLPKDWVAEVALAVPFVGSDGAPRAGPGTFPDRDRLPPRSGPGKGPRRMSLRGRTRSSVRSGSRDGPSPRGGWRWPSSASGRSTMRPWVRD